MKQEKKKKSSKTAKAHSKKARKTYAKPQLKREGDLFKNGWGGPSK